ncbi:Invasion protein IalB, involved in pathogenesis [Paracoccus aminovorans]|uniref:Invasion protein IalB, involved in pathogenesis n=2 Tax=Paracoccus aminovorans TaxID=34004 RepID=A0A1I2YZW2_9RHOB|nr:invasion associated locus B family protein [Paracoccus aminovorans]CQR85879.1 invasion associated locus B family protein [Paracoccus aminovorans]SFH31000.1 Invasion protein IalB, involved in pathogenesis [Paracoccus aminovorans]
MANRTSAALIAALFTLTGTAASVMAQDATTPAPAEAPAEAPASETPAAAPAATETPAAETPATAAEAPAETPAADGEPKVGQPYVKSTNGDWTLRCMKTDNGKDPCELFQLLKDQNDSPVAEASVIPMTGNVQAVITFIAPLETDLQAGLGLQVDAAKEARYPFMLCAQVGCISRIGLADAELAPLKKGNKATVSVLPFGAPKEQMVKLNLSLKGFTAGMTALAEANKGLTETAPAAAPAAEAPKP